jgi:carboxypeptidase Taq
MVTEESVLDFPPRLGFGGKPMSEPLPLPYRKLRQRGDEAYLLATACGLLEWDQETGMPGGAVEFRSAQIAHLEGKVHALMTGRAVDEWIAGSESHPFPPDSPEAINVREWRHDYNRAARLPRRLVEEFARARSLAHAAWQEARAKAEFPLFQPHLETILRLKLEMAKCWGYRQHPYDALLEGYERGATVAQLDALFDRLQPELVDLVGAATGREGKDARCLLGTAPVAAQQAFNREVAAGIGFDFEAGRIDTAVHPFCTTLGPRDIRLTTRYAENDFTSSLFGVLHEAGHGMYEQGLPFDPTHPALPRARAVSLGIHESQSRLWENHVGRSKTFWKRWLPGARRHFPHLEGVKPKQATHAVNTARRSFIRVEADEVTYDLHILLRYRLEKALVSGELAVSDVPGAWNEMFRQLFGLNVKSDRDGCLQDVHWSFGLIGYFPTYSLGNINAAQLFQAAMKDSTVATDLEEGRYESLLAWLREHIHRHGTHHLPADLIRRATGERPRPEYLLNHLRDRYL